MINLATLGAAGAALGIHDRDTAGTQDNLVVHHFGYPRKSGSFYGVQLPFDQSHAFQSLGTVIDAVRTFAQAYYANLGTDTTSHLRIVVGVVSCCQSSPANPTGDLDFMRGHGTAWANTMSNIRAQLTGGIASRVDVVGGYDMEPDWNRPYASTEWATRFALQGPTACNTGSTGYDQGCLYSYSTVPISVSGTNCAASETVTSWTACDIWYVAWGVKKSNSRIARPLPQIYHRYNPSYPQYPWGVDATQWKDLSLFSANQMNAGPMYFVGSLTQRADCGDGCPNGNNYPEEGYDLLSNALASNPATGHYIRWMTDIGNQP